MTQPQLAVVAALSLAATGLVLADGAGTESSAAVREAVVRVLAADSAVAPAAAGDGPQHAARPPAIPASDTSSFDDDTFADAGPATAPAAEEPEETPEKETPAKAAEPKPSKARHVFVITLTGTTVEQTFAEDSAATYLAGELRPQGTLLDNFAPLDRADTPNQVALVSGQPPNTKTQADCAVYEDFSADDAPDKKGVMQGDGCIYPSTVLTIGDQVTASGQTWRAYVQGMDRGDGTAATCRYPDAGPDPWLHGRPDDQYGTRRNPFVYFHSLLDLGDCMANDVDLSLLETDLKAEHTTPNLSFVVPDLCSSATEVPCADGRPGGLAEADAFLQEWVPKIRASKAYGKDGLIAIVFLSSSVPLEPGQPADAAPPRTGVLLLSKYAEKAATISTPQDPYSLLRTLEELFAFTPLAKAKKAESFAKAALPAAFPKS